MDIKISDFEPFIAVATFRSFRLAAEAAGVTSSAMSHSIRQLEEQLKIRLFNRTTRSVALTDAGHQLFESLSPLFSSAREAVEAINDYRTTPIGTLRINAVRLGGRYRLAPLVAGFTQKYPDVRVEIAQDDNLVDIVSSEYDAGVRLSEIIEKDMISIPLGKPIRYAVVASPEYLQHHAAPERPHDLLQHSCIKFRYPGGRSYQWQFGRDHEQLAISVQGMLEVNDLDIALSLALQGAGIGYVLSEMAEPHLRSGKLISLLDEWLPELPGFYLYYSNRKFASAAFQAFVEYIKAQR
ncbi:TPA: LysR family transcriptional regulator [Kluyvera cryocrescens]|nr:LysR family transcriptional regulator [Kluyvera cryocrescens]